MELENKLRKYEAIEMDLGIPLEVLFKALKQGKVWACENSCWGYSYHNVVGFNLNELILQSKFCSYSAICYKQTSDFVVINTKEGGKADDSE